MWGRFGSLGGVRKRKLLKLESSSARFSSQKLAMISLDLFAQVVGFSFSVRQERGDMRSYFPSLVVHDASFSKLPLSKR